MSGTRVAAPRTSSPPWLEELSSPTGSLCDGGGPGAAQLLDAVDAWLPGSDGGVRPGGTTGRFLSGVVRAESLGDMPVAGVRVLALGGGGSFAETVTGANGWFQAGPLPTEGPFLLLVAREDWLPFCQRTRAPATLALSLSAAWRASGHVRDERGPVAGAWVEARSRKRVQRSRTDAQGFFHFETLAARSQGLSVLHEGRQAGQTLDWARDDVELVLGPSAVRLWGRVTDESGQPLEDAEVSLSSEDESLVRRTDSQGAFVFESLAPLPRDFTVRAAHHVPRRLPTRRFEVSQEVNVSLARARRIEGRVVDEQGRAVKSAQVSVVDTPLPLLPATSGAKGEFLLEADRPRVEVQAVHPDFLTVTTVLEAPARDARLELHRGATLEVTLVEEGGRPVARAEVSLQGPNPGPRESWPQPRLATTGEQGTVRFGGLLPGQGHVTAHSPEGEHRSVGVSFAVEGQDVRELRLTLPARMSLSGRVVDRNGGALDGVRLAASCPPEVRSRRVETLSGPGGTFSWTDLPRGRCQLWVLSPEYEVDAEPHGGPPVLEVAPDQTGILLVLRDVARIRGRVVDEAGAPITSFLIRGDGLLPKTHPEGRFSIPAYGNDAEISARGFQSVHVRFESSQSQDLGDVVLKADPTRSLQGQIVDARTGAPLSDVHIQIFPVPGCRRHAYSVQLDSSADGRFNGEVPDCGVFLTTNHSTYVSQQRVVAREQSEVRIELEPGASLEGRVELGGEPVLEGQLQVNPEREGRGYSAPIWNGHYQLARLPPGRYGLYVRSPSGVRPRPLSALHFVSLGSGEHQTVDVLDPAPSATLEVLGMERGVEVHLLPGSWPLMGPRQGLYTRLNEGIMGRSAGEGVRRFDSLPAGHYTLFAVSRDESATQVHREELEIAAGSTRSLTLLLQWQLFEEGSTRP